MEKILYLVVKPILNDLNVRQVTIYDIINNVPTSVYDDYLTKGIEVYDFKSITIETFLKKKLRRESIQFERL